MQGASTLSPPICLSWHVLLPRQATISYHVSSCRCTSSRREIFSVYGILSLHDVSPCKDMSSPHLAGLSHGKPPRHATPDRCLTRRPFLTYPHFLECHRDMNCLQLMTSRNPMYHQHIMTNDIRSDSETTPRFPRFGGGEYCALEYVHVHIYRCISIRMCA